MAFLHNRHTGQQFFCEILARRYPMHKTRATGPRRPRAIRIGPSPDDPRWLLIPQEDRDRIENVWFTVSRTRDDATLFQQPWEVHLSSRDLYPPVPSAAVAELTIEETTHD